MATFHNEVAFLDAMDEETAALLIQLQLEDQEALKANAKGKGKEGELSDSELAFNLYKEELERIAGVMSDRQMTRSIARACQTDGTIVAASISQEQAAASDREEACRLGGVGTPPPVDRWTVTAEEMDDELLAKLSALYVESPFNNVEDAEDTATPDSDDDNGGESSSSRPRDRYINRPTANGALYRQCIACQDYVKFFDTARAPCSHEYCRPCLKSLFQASLSDESLFPPRCCKQPIRTGGLRMFLGSDILAEYEEKKIEFDTPDRTYCSNPLCSTFIKRDGIKGDRATCPVCRNVTCTMCKGPEHTGDCPADTNLQAVLQTATEQGWQRCYSCRRLVELDVGCNHMTCLCGTQFCYICGLRWKSCSCQLWNEERLMGRANQLVARQPNRPVEPQQQRALIEAAAQNLRENHNCDHERWTYVRGRHQCEQCFHTLPSYIFECNQCGIQACNRCRRNRM